MALELRHFRLVRAIRLHGTLSAAADRLGLTQPALSHQLREAERRLGSAVVTRQGRRLTLTPAGERLLDAAETVLPTLAEAEVEAQLLGGGPDRIVRFALAGYTAFHWLPAFLRKLNRDLPDVAFDVQTEGMARPFSMLKSGALDLALVQAPPDRPARARAQVDRIAVSLDPLVAVAPPDHRFAALSEVKAEDLAPETYISYSRTPEEGLEFRTIIAPSRRLAKAFIRVEVTQAILDLIAAGSGISILSRWAVAEALDSGRLIARPVVGPLAPDGLHTRWDAVLLREAEAVRDVAHLLADHLRPQMTQGIAARP